MLKAELADLLEEDAKADKLRSLPLYICKITGWKFVCSKCYDKVYTYAIAKQRPQHWFLAPLGLLRSLIQTWLALAISSILV